MMHPLRFVLFNATGAAIWVFSLVSAGYFLGNIPVVREHFSLVVYGIILVSVLPVIIEAGRSALRGRKESNPENEHVSTNRHQ
jgi:membrane-associated protein